MKLLIIGDIGIIFTFEYITEIASKFPNCSIDILSFSPKKEANGEREKALKALGCRIFYPPRYRLLKKHRLLYILIRLVEFFRYGVCRKYDTVNIHFPGVDALSVCFWASKNTRIITSLYGSDLLRASKRGLRTLEKLLRRSDAVTVASRYIMQQVSEKFSARFDGKTHLARYGSNAAAFMSNAIGGMSRQECKAYFGFPQDRITVLCGYNGSRAQRQPEILRELEKLPEDIQKKLFLILQCSYGFTEDYHQELSKALAASPLEGVIVTDFMQGETLARFRNSMDIFLNLQPTDVLSATMIEELEAGVVVVKGDWLCYPDLEERNVYIRSISAIDRLSREMEMIVADFPGEQAKAKENKGIWEILSWQAEYSKWEQILLFENQ